MPHESRPGDQQLEQYLLGLLAEEDAERLDEMSVVDDEVALRLRVMEDDLVDAYVRGTMPDDTRARFESTYLASPRRRQKVKFAEDFLGVADGATVPVDADTGHAPSARVVSPSMPWRGLGVAATLVLVAAGALFFGELRLRNGLFEARNQSAVLESRARELEQQLNDQRSANAEMAKELEGVRASLAELTERSSADRPPGQAAPAAATIALVLPPQTRGGGPMATMAVPRGATDVSFELQLEADDFTQYEVALKDPAIDRILWRSRRMAARSAGDLPVVSVTVPAGALTSRHYSLELTGYAATGSAEVVSSYPFRIVRR